MAVLEHFLGSLSQPADILALNETWLLPGEEQFFNLPGYETLHQVRGTRETRGGGLALFIAKHLQYADVFGEVTNEVQFLGVTLPQLNVSIITFYRPPGSQNVTHFFSRLEYYLDKYKRSIVVGDSNFDLLKPELSNVQLYKTIIEASFFTILNQVSRDNATRITSSSKTLLDHSFTDLTPSFDFSFSTKESFISDHQCLITRVNAPLPSSSLSNKTYVYIDFQAISQSLTDLPHGKQDFDAFHERLCDLVTQHTTTKTVRTKKANNDQPWFEPHLKTLKKSIKKFNDLTRDYPANTTFQDEYRSLIIEYRNKVQSAKNRYFADLFKQNIHDRTKLWRVANRIIHNKSLDNMSCQFSLQTPAGLIHDQLAVANLFNQHFAGVCDSENFVNSEANLNPDYGSYSPPITEFMNTFSPATTEEVGSIIAGLSNSSPGYDKIPSSFLKQNIEFFKPFLTEVANHIFQTGVYPRRLKHAIITPVFKKGDKTNANHFRPISVLPGFSKVFEILMKARLLSHLSNNNLISPRQYGFLKNRSTTSAAVSLLDKVFHSLNDKLKTACLFLDIAKAFDRMKYEILRRILLTYGVRDLALSLIMSFLTNRTQSVRVGGFLSGVLDVLGGLPQGSCLVLLFLVYINGLLHLQLYGVAQSFCDDTALSYQANSFEDLQYQMTKDLDVISQFLRSLNMALNVSKTKFMVFLTRNSATSGLFDGLNLGDGVVERVEVYEYLGLTIDSKLSFQQHASKIIQKTAPYAGLLRRLNPILPQSMLWQIYYAHIHSRFTYLLPIWSGVSQQKMSCIERIQNKSIKNILKLPYLTSSATLYNERLLQFSKMAEYESILLIYKIVTSLVSVDSHLTHNFAITNRSTRQSGALRPPNYVLSLAQNTLFYRGISQYNTFISSPAFEPATTVGRFKANLKKYIFDRN